MTTADPATIAPFTAALLRSRAFDPSDERVEATPARQRDDVRFFAATYGVFFVSWLVWLG